MSAASYRDAWQDYQAAIRQLYQAPEQASLQTERAVGEVYLEQLEQHGDEVVARSEEVRQSLEPVMQAADLDQRELAGLKLLAAAAFDLSVAGDLLEMESEDPGQAVERSASSALFTATELVQVLDAPLEGGVSGLLEVERAVLPTDPLAARKKLVEAVNTFLNDIPDAASELSQKAVVGIANLGLGPAQIVASVAVQELAARVPEGLSIVARKAAALVIEAVQKLRASLGEEQEQKIRQKAEDWLKEIQAKRDSVAALLDNLYETGRIGTEAHAAIDAAPAGLQADAYNAATTKLEELLGRFTKTKSTLDKVMTVLSLVKVSLLPAVPWGPIALYGSYIGILGYSIYSGADYLDSHRLDKANWLNRVRGLRAIVKEALAPAVEGSQPSG